MQLIEAAALASLLLFYGCRSSHITDEKLVVAFNDNRELFDKLAALSATGDLVSSDPPDPSIGIPESSESVFADLKRRTGFVHAQIYVKTGPPRTLWIPVELRGTLSTSSSGVGYVYSRSALNPLVGTVWQDVEDKAAYKPIAENWYIFVSN